MGQRGLTCALRITEATSSWRVCTTRIESIHDLETESQKVFKCKAPWRCVASQCLVAITATNDGLHLYSTDGDIVHVIPDSTGAFCAAFHPRNTNILGIGYQNGTVRMWDVSMQVYVSSFHHHHFRRITNILFAPDGRLFLSSWEKTASIVTLDDQFEFLSLIKFKGHAFSVRDILSLTLSNNCVSCSSDKTIKVWDCETGTCLRTLTEHTSWVTSLAIHPNGQYFASGSLNRAVIIWSCETFEVLRRMEFPNWVQALLFDEIHTLYAAVFDRGVMSCNALTGEVGQVMIASTQSCFGLSLGWSPLYAPQNTLVTHRNSTAPAPKPWTSCTHARWPLPAQHIVHKAVVVLWKTYIINPRMYLPPELVEIVLKQVA
jgi:WD40 repeat protein